SDAEKYDLYFRSAIKDWRESRIVGSMAHGVVAPEAFLSQFPDVIGIYTATKDAASAANALQAIADQSRVGK
ncbi:MAG TPA: carbohydrate ABC transporter substrate-binding protein, partial [Spirochaetia bacterium]|nr:carbohydrate ABC transporter substrate-binding protein [Spirochaetia bacterium]